MSAKFNVLISFLILWRSSFAALNKGDKCSLKDGSSGTCKLIKACPSANQLIKAGVFPVICGIEGTASIVCCKDGEDQAKTINTTTTTNQVNGRKPGDISRQKCEEYSEYAYEKIPSPTLLLKPHITKKLVCDIQRNNKFFSGSSEASRREFPHMALIGYRPKDEVIWNCQGCLISENFVLTAAQCLFTPSNDPAKLVRVGLTNKTDPTHMQERTVNEIIPYPEYEYPSKYHDIGLLRLSKDIQFNTYARPACLHTEKYSFYYFAIASGWSDLIVFGKKRNKDLMQTTLELFYGDECNQGYKQNVSPTGVLKDGIVEDLMICAGYSSIMTAICRGDFGGPLQIYHEETDKIKCMYDIIGVTSFIRDCGFENPPGVHTRVAAYIKWIEDTVWPNCDMSSRLSPNVVLFIFLLSGGSFAILYEGDKCSLKDGIEGTCKFITQCPTAMQLLRTGVYPIICGFQGTLSIVCCKNEEVLKGTSASTMTTSVPESTKPTYKPQDRGAANTTSRTPGDISKQKCKEYAKYAYERSQSPTLSIIRHYSNTLECDQHRIQLIVGGTLASRREFPHMALIGYKTDNEVLWGCGGSVISENFVLTSAHCLKKQQLGPATLVRVGFTNKTDLTHMQERTVSEIIPYPEYSFTRYHDVGLLKLSRNLELNTYVRPACLQTKKNIPFEKAIASGWGVTEFSGDTSSDLLKVVLEFFSVDKCNYTYRRDISPTALKDGIVDDLMICAGSSKEFKDTCQGDSGGPLQVYHKETEEVKCMYDIIGVTSFGKSCGLATDVPGVYSRVSAYIKWIEDTVWPN
ncbi:uncharacterized protein LOC108904131 [Anoplophora glabripennis]|uniref:uncharacterized protein LOC108904131 n=1 Tax=Anoplophora glabripennis TaxID=217634 RepID=UPI0008740B17|nr:uncharacterized protein LOC108904131 [Anoplophora glabripennis]